MQDWPATVEGQLLEVRGFDAQFSEAVAILKLKDGRTRGIPSGVLDDSGKRALAEWLAARPKPEPVEEKAFVFAQGDYDRVKDAQKVNFRESEHFTFHWGKGGDASGKIVFDDPAFLDRNTKYFEEIWVFYRDVLKATMPGADANPPKKLNVYITGTGLPKHKDGFAFAAQAIIINPAAMGPGSGVMPHEFAHCVQLASGGFRNSELVGWFWECHANWCGARMLPAWAPALEVYAERCHYELTSSRMNYGSWPILELLAADERFGPSFNFDIWTNNHKNERDQSIEDPLQTMMRLSGERNLINGEGIDAFADIVGTLAARMFDWDFTQQYTYQKTVRAMENGRPGAQRSRTILRKSPDQSESEQVTWWQPMFSQSPRTYGINLIDLELPADSSVSEISATLRPMTDLEGAGWRYTLVAVGADGLSRYGTTVKSGPAKLTLRSGDNRIGLAVAATPTVYEPVPFRPGYGRKDRYPYEVSFTGVKPATTPWRVPISKPSGKAHANGGGFVADTAKVDAGAYVGPQAMVLDKARVLGKARIEDRAVVRNEAEVAGDAIVRDDATIAEKAKVRARARVSGWAVVTGQATLDEDARVGEAVHIDGTGRLTGDFFARGWGEIHTDAKTTLGGTVTAGEDLEVHLAGHDKPKIDGGMLYGYAAAPQLQTDMRDNKGLFAHWIFDSAGGRTVLDEFGDCQGWLRSGAAMVAEGEKHLLKPGTDGYALIEGHPCDAAELTIDALVRRDGTGAGTIIAFEGPSGTKLSLGVLDDGKPVATLAAGGKTITVTAKSPLEQATDKSKLSRITLTLNRTSLKLFVDAAPVVQTATQGIAPDAVRATHGKIGRGFPGVIGDVRLYRKAFESVKAVPGV